MKTILLATLVSAFASVTALAAPAVVPAADTADRADSRSEARRDFERDRLWTCYATNLRGDSFTAYGVIRANAAARALARCEAASFECRFSGCYQ